MVKASRMLIMYLSLSLAETKRQRRTPQFYSQLHAELLRCTPVWFFTSIPSVVVIWLPPLPPGWHCSCQSHQWHSLLLNSTELASSWNSSITLSSAPSHFHCSLFTVPWPLPTWFSFFVSMIKLELGPGWSVLPLQIPLGQLSHQCPPVTFNSNEFCWLAPLCLQTWHVQKLNFSVSHQRSLLLYLRSLV